MYDHLNVVSDNFPHIPAQAFLYQPISKNPDIQNQTTQSLQTDDFIFVTKSLQIKRLIFQGDTKYTKFQNTKLEEFQHYIQRKNIQLDKRWTRSWKLRWLQSTNYYNKKTVQDMEQYIQYQNKNKQIILKENVQKYMKAGIYYLAGRDSKFRPILILDVKKMAELNIPEEEVLQCEIFFFQFNMRNMLIPGKVQMWNTIIDVGYQGVMSMMGPMKSSISFLQSSFRSRMYVAFIIRPSGTSSFLWSIAQKFLQQDTKRKVVFVDGQVIHSLLQYCNPSQLYKKFGGSLEDLVGDCWPPRKMSSQYSSKLETVVLSEEQYRQKYEKKQFLHSKVYLPFTIAKVVQQSQQKKTQQKVEQSAPSSAIKRSQRRIDINLIEIELKINQRLQKLKEQDIMFLSQINLEAQKLCPDSGFDWLLG